MRKKYGAHDLFMVFIIGFIAGFVFHDLDLKESSTVQASETESSQTSHSKDEPSLAVDTAKRYKKYDWDMFKDGVIDDQVFMNRK